jgi:hypothetical protein
LKKRVFPQPLHQNDVHNLFYLIEKCSYVATGLNLEVVKDIKFTLENVLATPIILSYYIFTCCTICVYNNLTKRKIRSCRLYSNLMCSHIMDIQK